MRTELTSGTL